MTQRYGAAIGAAQPSHGQTVIHPERSQWCDVAAQARADGFEQLLDLTAVDYLTFNAPRQLPEDIKPERFEVVAALISRQRGERLRMRTQVPADDPTVDTLFDLWPSAENLEREAHDMFGIVFEGHPDASRILMPEDWIGHPLRKDYDIGRIPVQFKAASNVR